MLSTAHPKVLQFYRANPHVDFEQMNLLLVDFLETLGDGAGKSSRIEAEVREIKQGLAQTQAQLAAQMADAHRGFVETLKMLLSINATEGAERAAALLERHMTTVADRLHCLVPQLTAETSGKVTDQLALLQKTLQLDLQQALGDRREGALLHFLDSFDNRLAGLQQPLLALVQSGSDAVAKKLATLNDEVKTAKGAQEKLTGELSQFLQKYNSGAPQFKGKQSEDMLARLLCELYPTAAVKNTTAVTASGDFMLVRGGTFPKIMVENKNYQRNVEQEEVDKFLRDAAVQRCSAVMISQFSGIVSKPNFFVEVNDGNVLVYLHNVNYSKDQVRLAVDVIDHLSARVGAREAAAAVPKEVLDGINDEVQRFVKKKEALASTVRDTHRTLLAQLDELHLPVLFKLLSETYTSPQTQTYVCPLCNTAFPTKRGLACHKRTHAKP